MNRTEIELRLLRDWTWFLETLDALAPDVLDREVTTDQHDPATRWTVKDHVAHCFGVYASGNAAVREFLDTGGDQPFFLYLLPVGRRGLDPAKDMAELMKAVNETTHQIWRTYHDTTWPQLMAVGQAARSERLRLIAALTDEQLASPLPGGQWGDGSVGGYLLNAAGPHQRMHLSWVMRGLADGRH